MKWSFFTGWFQIQRELTTIFEEASPQQLKNVFKSFYVYRQENVTAVRAPKL